MDKPVYFLSAVYTISEYCKEIIRITEGKEYKDYLEDIDMRFSIERCLTVIGEAAARIRSIGRGREIPNISKIIATRNVLMHEYDAINHQTIWGTAKKSIPALLIRAEEILSQSPPPVDVDL